MLPVESDRFNTRVGSLPLGEFQSAVNLNDNLSSVISIWPGCFHNTGHIHGRSAR